MYPRMRADFTYCGQEQDRLFDAASDHHGLENICDTWEISRLVTRTDMSCYPLRSDCIWQPGDKAWRHSGQELCILCFEMEAAGLMDNFPCLVIREI